MISVGNQALKQKEYNVYIDESGDEGIKRGSKYFILTALIVDKEKDLEVSKNVDEIKNKLNIDIKSQLHWKNIKGYRKKLMIMKTVEESDVTLINIIIDTDEILFLTTTDIYYHFSGYLFERISWFVRDRKAVANINISSRGENLTKKNLVHFLKKNHRKFKIDYHRINDIKIIANAKRKMLQLADSCCSALGQAIKYADTKHYKYIYHLKSKLYMYKGNYISYGIKYVPSNVELPLEISNLIDFLDNKKSELSPD